MSLERLVEHRRLWRDKPVLPRVYEPWFVALLAPTARGARVLEIGSGPGFLAEYAHAHRPDLRFVASDLHATPWNDLSADACRLPLRSASVDAVLGIDVLHHLHRPMDLFSEAARILTPRGRLALVEPWITPLSFLVYRFFHQEECRLSVDSASPFPPDKESFEGNAAVPWRIVRDATEETWRALGLGTPVVRRLNTFAYLLSLGFRPATLLPGSLVSTLLAMDRLTASLGPLVALRALMAWDRACDLRE